MTSFRPVLALLALVLGASTPAAQVRLTIARLQYDGGGDWYANPSSLPNLLKAINEERPSGLNRRRRASASRTTGSGIIPICI